jgi:hypothetical protein
VDYQRANTLEQNIKNRLLQCDIPVIINSRYCREFQKYQCPTCEHNQGCYKLSKIYETWVEAGHLNRFLSNEEIAKLNEITKKIIEEEKAEY